MLGLTTETASRIVAEFKRQGLLTQLSQTRYRCDIPGLEKIAENGPVSSAD